MTPESFLHALLAAAVESSRASECLPAFIPPPPKGKTLALAFGKGAADMARVFERHYPAPFEGVALTRYGYALPCDRFRVLEAAHPVPDAAGEASARQMLQMAQALGQEDLLVCLISGGGSALLSLACEGISPTQKQEAVKHLLRSGATISEMNVLRRRLSSIKGGRLALAAAPARVVNLIVSDVAGDDPCDIASGPSVPDPTHSSDALDAVRRYGVPLPNEVIRALESGALETPKPHDPRLPLIETHMVATPARALEAAASVARAHEVTPYILSDRIEGESRHVAKVLAAMALQVRNNGAPFTPPCVLLSGGETTVDVKGTGRGGPNAELMLAMALVLRGTPSVYALAADTDGADGASFEGQDVAGAWISPDTLVQAQRLGLSPMRSLEENDAHGFFASIGGALHTGPSYTNVNDFRAVYLP